MNVQSAWRATLDFFPCQAVVVETTAALLTSDAGLLLFRQFDQQRRVTETFAAALEDRRHEPTHSFLEMVRARVYGILADYEDQNDHDTLRSDPLFKLLADRAPDGADLASQPTLSRFENAITPGSLLRLEEWLFARFIAAFPEPPRQLTLDIDCFDDPAYGQQQLVMFHGYYNQHQYLPRLITCAENDLVVMAALLHGSAHAGLGAAADVRRVVERLRQAWPDVQIHLRADSGFALPALYETCEALGVFYSIGLGMNAVLKRASEPLLAEALQQFEATGQSQRLFLGLEYQAGSWPQERFVALKAEANAQGTNRRAGVTNRPGAVHYPQAAYDEYADRGESENRNKELKGGLCAGRLSDCRFMANYFRLYLHITAYNLLAGLRRQVADPPPAEPVAGATPSEPLPLEAADPQAKRQYFNRRRERDPLGEGHICTWRTRLIKVAAQITVSTRRIVLRISAAWPHLRHYQAVAAALAGG